MSKNTFQNFSNVDSQFSFERKQQERQGEDMFWPFSLIVEIPVTLIKGHIWLACKHDFFFQSPILTLSVRGKQKEHILPESDTAC